MAKQNYELLMKNQEAYPTGSAPFPKVNAAAHNKSEKRQNHTMVVDMDVARDRIITVLMVEIIKEQ